MVHTSVTKKMELLQHVEFFTCDTVVGYIVGAGKKWEGKGRDGNVIKCNVPK